MNLSSKSRSILIVSNEPWGDQWFSKHHYAYELSKLDHQVYYLNPPGSWSLRNLINNKVSLSKISDNLTILSVSNPLPLRIFVRLFTWSNDRIIYAKLRRVLRLPRDLIIWQFDFHRFVYQPSQDEKRIYHVADPYMHAWSDKLIANKADQIVCTSPKYVPYYHQHFPLKRILHIPHGISEKEYEVSASEVNRIRNLYGSYMILIGSINDDLDFVLMGKMSELSQLLILGKENLKESTNKSAWEAVKENKKINYLGVVHASELKHYIKAAEACLLLYKFDLIKTIGSGSPLKILNYLTQFKPIITSIDPEIPELLEKGIYWATSHEQYLELTIKALDKSLDVDSDAIKEYLSQHTYPILINKILRGLYA